MKLFSILLLTVLCGCATYEENKQLTNINKDWNRIIRASHIYPVYPLSQDILPGDIFLVSSDIDDTSAWSQPGYLPLDHLIARLSPDRYASFYSNSWNAYQSSLPPEFLKDNSWSNAPVAGFPSYSFTVKQGGGSSIALPIQGIPVGLSLMGAKQASGYVSLADAHTYGIDEISLRRQVWDYINANRSELLFLFTPDQTNFLQVVTRVYLAGQVTVSMVNDSARGGSVWGGSPKEVTTPALTTNGAVGNFANLLSAANISVPAGLNASGILPGGTLKFNTASSRSVSMSESFPRPIVIGYNGFSFAVARKDVTFTNSDGTTYSKRELLLGESIISNSKLLRIRNGIQNRSISSMTLAGSFQKDAASEILRAWVIDPKDSTKYNTANRQHLRQWMDINNLKDVDISAFLDLSNFAKERPKAVDDLKIP